MKKISIILFIILLSGFIYLWLNLFPIISGFGAKALCSCAYVGQRNAQDVIDKELKAFPLSLGTFSLSQSDSSAVGSVWGLAKAKAVYTKGWGCTLLRGVNEDDFRKERKPMNLNRPELSDTMEWPIGSLVVSSSDSSIDQKALSKAVERAFTENVPDKVKNTRAVLVVKDGKIIAERYAAGFDPFTPQIGWSMTKSVLATWIGMLEHDGYLNVNDKTGLQVWNGDNRKDISIDNLLRMSSGLEWDEVYSGPSTATDMLYGEPDMGLYSSGQPLEFDTDSKWEYSSGTSNLLSYILKQRLKPEDYYSYLYERLFSPLGIRSAVIESDVSGTYVGSSYMWASPRDWARLGQLYLNKGNWNGEQIFKQDWCDYVTTQTKGVEKGRYGAHFWLNAGEPENRKNRKLPDVSADVYSMNGYEGQRVFIIPSKNMIVVRLGQNRRHHFDFNAFLSGILDCVKSPAQK